MDWNTFVPGMKTSFLCACQCRWLLQHCAEQDSEALSVAGRERCSGVRRPAEERGGVTAPTCLLALHWRWLIFHSCCRADEWNVGGDTHLLFHSPIDSPFPQEFESDVIGCIYLKGVLGTLCTQLLTLWIKKLKTRAVIYLLLLIITSKPRFLRAHFCK